jgi:predicted lipoprotein with Yx(FWY)xxD motif
MRCTLRRTGGLSWTARAVVATLMVSGSAVASVGIAASSQAQVRPASAGTSATVVKEAMRTGFGLMLVTPSTGMALYEHPSGPCNASCRSIWPPLLMPTGTKTPKGAPCLATAKLGTKLQVTYHKQRLYTFTGDTGHSVNGNGLSGFKAAKVTKACT